MQNGSGPVAPSIAPSNTALFLTNLRLLDFPHLPDWPSITVQTFSTKDANQNQKQRIRCTEWALFRLFELWDPAETREKLQPFFPPLEPLQSLNLRAALYRALNDLKKNGLLGRETTLRKTMLDDCAGPKLLEVLAVFSTNVAKAVLADTHQPGSYTAVRRLASAQALDDRSQQSLLPLAVAHKSSLTALLRRRTLLQKRYAAFSRALDEADEDLKGREARRKHHDHQAQVPELEAVRAQVLDSWIGNAQWADVLLHGEATAGDQLLSKGFDAAWHDAVSGGALEGIRQDSGLRARLERRVQHQKHRVAHWHALRDEFKVQGNNPDVTATGNILSSLSLDAHKAVRIGSQRGEAASGDVAHNQHADGRAPAVTARSQAYDNLVTGMKEQLDAVAVPSHRSSIAAGQPPAGSPQQSRTSARSRLSASFDILATPTVRTQEKSNGHGVQPDVDQMASPSFDANHEVDAGVDSAPEVGHLAAQVTTPQPHQGAGPVSTSQSDHWRDDRIPTPTTGRHQESSPPCTPEKAPEDDLAAQIIASIPDETPEQPVATQSRRLTLAERTRMSMAPRDNQHTRAPPSTLCSADTANTHLAQEQTSDTGVADHRATLLDRTRQSILQLPGGDARQHKPRTSMAAKEARRFPVNQFETPRRGPSVSLAGTSTETDSDRSTPRGALFSAEAEYDSVFKSRPKIALSPVGTPQEDEDMSALDEAVASSPLGRMH